MSNLPENIITALERLEEHGFSAYVVGGCVRCMLMSLPPKDYDVCTNATPQEVKSCFSDMRTIDTGIAHGTVTVIVNDTPIEITTYRFDGVYHDNRHPEHVIFIDSLYEDLSRRDFTMNAIAMDKFGNITDPFNGSSDINKRLVRTVGNPVARFAEDGLRILRALRFSATLCFGIESKTSKAIHDLKELLINISYERIYSEFVKLICGPNATGVLTEYRDVFASFFLCIADSFPMLCTLPDDIPMRLAYITYGHPDDIKTCLATLKPPKRIVTETLFFVENERLLYNANKLYLRLALAQHGVLRIKQLLIYMSAKAMCNVKDQLAYVDELERNNMILTFSDMAINGNDLKMLGVKGKAIGKLLYWLFVKMVGGEVENEKAALLDAANELYKESKMG